MHTTNLIDALEPRRFLAADLNVALTSTTLPDSLIAGASSKPFILQATLTNVGDPLPKSPNSSIALTASLRDGQGALTTIGSATVDAKRIAPAKFAKAPVKLTIPSSLAQGTYTLVLSATVTGGSLAEETNTENNSASGKSVSVTPANADIALSGSSTLTGSVETGSAGTARVTITNNGNIPAKTKGTLELLSTVNSTTTTLATVSNVSINIQPGKSFSSKPVKFTVAGSGSSNISLGLSARFTPTTPLTNDNTSDNSASITTLTVTPPPPSPFTSVNGSVNLAGTITFKKTQRVGARGFFNETGTYTDSAGNTGTYTMSVVPTGTVRRGILLTNSSGSPFLTGNFSDSITGVGGKTFTFSTSDPGNSVGTFDALGTTFFVRNGR